MKCTPSSVDTSITHESPVATSAISENSKVLVSLVIETGGRRNQVFSGCGYAIFGSESLMKVEGSVPPACVVSQANGEKIFLECEKSSEYELSGEPE